MRRNLKFWALNTQGSRVSKSGFLPVTVTLNILNSYSIMRFNKIWIFPMLNKKLIPLTFLPAILSLFLVSCDIESGPPSDYKFFDYDLQGTWVSNDPGKYSGKLVITYNTITITGYGESQTSIWGNDTERPFRDFTKRAALLGYSENGHIFIKDGGLFQEGIPYTLYSDNYSLSRQFLRFSFGGRQERLEKQ